MTKEYSWQHPGLSVIIPIHNDNDKVKILLKRLTASLKQAKLSNLEIILVDDHSTDGTLELCQTLAQKYSWLKVVQKKGKSEKVYSLLEGLKIATNGLLCFIDANLQYPPEAIPEMIDKILIDGSDIVVANRTHLKTSLNSHLRIKSLKLLSVLTRSKQYDTQSGLKVFRADLLTYFDLKPNRWTFDTELLSYAKTLGSRIDIVDIEFSEHIPEARKHVTAKNSYESLRHYLKLQFKPLDYIPFNQELIDNYGSGFFYKGQIYVSHSNIKRHDTALERVLPFQTVILICVPILILSALLIKWHTTISIIVAIMTYMYFLDLLFNLFLISRSFSHSPELSISQKQVDSINDNEWPTYTILCPLYRESMMLPQFVDALSHIDYDFKKMQVLLLLEEDDSETLEAARAMKLPKYFQIVVVPHSYPKTKPKACNYGLNVARGEYVVIFDAEDVPNTSQLKQAYLAFQNTPNNVVCIQAKLNFYNPHQNLLTRIFTAEYSLWFDLILTGLQSIGAPIPLGGTSNHFITKKLRELGGWDAFNVTEDADLGIRLAKKGYQTAIMDAVTLEEANSNFRNWLKQRSRWIKGYMQTYLVHTRHLSDFPKGRKRIHALSFQLVIGGKLASMFINPFMWTLIIIYFTFRPIIGPTIDSFFPAPVLYFAVSSLIFGNFLYLYYYMIGCAKHGHYDIIKYAFLVPIYWLAMSVAGWIALVELIYKPHYWNKTKHGMHLTNNVGSFATNKDNAKTIES
jgi:cellulose synthase/poly-beta-1,6-N-acetylglucosamine synthase-like glycosyltransferase